MTRHETKLFIFGVVCVSLLSDAQAGGLFVQGAGPQAQARAGAFIAKADDPTALLHNPAGFAKMDGTHVTLGANLVDYDVTYQRNGSYEASGSGAPFSYEGAPYPQVKDRSEPDLGIGGFQAIPFIGLSTDIGKSHWPVRFGFGVLTPQGYSEREFIERHEMLQGPDPAPGPQRYDVITQKAAPIQPSIAVAYSPFEMLDVGLRLSWGIITVEGERTGWSVPNFEEFEGRDSVFRVTNAVDRYAPSYGLGVLYRPTSFLELGAAYHSEVRARAVGEGRADTGDIGGGIGQLDLEPIPDSATRCATGGVRDAVKTCVDTTIPRHASLGARYILRAPDGSERADVELDIGWEDWSAASNTRITIDARDTLTSAVLEPTVSRHNFRDTYSVRLGGSYAQPIASYKLIFRAGAAYDTSAAPDQYTRLDFDGKSRTTLTGGVAFETRHFRVDAGGGVVLEPTITVEETCQAPLGPTATSRGCDGSGQDLTPTSERDQPDPIQPKLSQALQVESPYNDGRYESGYILLSLGVTAWF